MLAPATDAALIILLSLDARPASVVAALKELGFEVEVLHLGDRTGLFARDPRGELPAESIGRIPGVERVMSLSPRAPLALATKDREGGGIAVGPARFGGGFVSIIAGPCAIEDGESIKDIARQVAAAGATALRGGAFKVRTSPHSFQGGGLEALAELAVRPVRRAALFPIRDRRRRGRLRHGAQQRPARGRSLKPPALGPSPTPAEQCAPR